MTVKEAIELINSSKINPDRIQQWADLGCGTGVFSHALASLLPQGSSILCVDREEQFLKDTVVKGVTLDFKQEDFMRIDFGEKKFDGFLLANSLHFVKEKYHLFGNLIKSLSTPGRIIIVEYDTEKNTQWVPYPLSFSNLQLLLDSNGLHPHQVRKIGQHPSIYGPEKMYACEIIFS